MEMEEEKFDIISYETIYQLVTERKMGGFGQEFFTNYLIEFYKK